MVNKLAIVNPFGFHTLHRNIAQSAIITRKTTEIKGKSEKEPYQLRISLILALPRDYHSRRGTHLCHLRSLLHPADRRKQTHSHPHGVEPGRRLLHPRQEDLQMG